MLSADQVIPAAAGYYTLTFMAETQDYARFPIVAWFYDGEATYPVVAGQGVEGVEFILCPDGSVNATETGKAWQTVGEWRGEIAGSPAGETNCSTSLANGISGDCGLRNPTPVTSVEFQGCNPRP